MQVTQGTKNHAPEGWQQEGTQQSQAYNNRIPTTFTFYHLPYIYMNCVMNCSFKNCVISLIVKFKYTLFYLFISQFTFINQESLLSGIIEFGNENISMTPSLVVF